MAGMRATITATAKQTRILIADEGGDRLIARLEPLSSAAHGRALPTLLEALALWHGEALSVVIYVDESFDWARSGLADALGFGLQTLFYQVEIVPLEASRRLRPKRLSGLGSFASERRRLG